MKQPSFWRSVQHAAHGLVWAVQTQRNARIHAVASLLAVLAGVACRLDRWEWVVLSLSMGLVWLAELLNTSIEATVDLVTSEVHPLARTAKDCAAGAVLVSAITAVVVGVLLFGPRLVEWAS